MGVEKEPTNDQWTVVLNVCTVNKETICSRIHNDEEPIKAQMVKKYIYQKGLLIVIMKTFKCFHAFRISQESHKEIWLKW